MSRSFAVIADETTLERVCGAKGLMGVYIVENGQAHCSIFESGASIDHLLQGKAVVPYRKGYERIAIDLEVEIEAISQIVDLAIEHKHTPQPQSVAQPPIGYTPVHKRKSGGLSVRLTASGLDVMVTRRLTWELGMEEGSTVALFESQSGRLAICPAQTGVALTSCHDSEYHLTLTDVFKELPIEMAYRRSDWVMPEYHIDGSSLIISKKSLISEILECEIPAVEPEAHLSATTEKKSTAKLIIGLLVCFAALIIPASTII